MTMIVDVNKVYVFSLNPLAAGIDDYVEFQANKVMYVKMKKLKQGPLKGLMRSFSYKNGQLLQAVIFYDDLPEKDAKQRLKSKIEAYELQMKPGGK